MSDRSAAVSRETRETTIAVKIDLDGKGDCEARTGIMFFDHLLSQLAQHGLFDISVSASGSDPHHVVEDVAICLGRALSQALGEHQGIRRMAHALVPMDEALALVALDISGRGHAVVDISLTGDKVGDMPAELVRHFLSSLALEGRFSLHARVLAGANDHHQAEALFKALARALDQATAIDPRLLGRVPSTKDVIES